MLFASLWYISYKNRYVTHLKIFPNMFCIMTYNLSNSCRHVAIVEPNAYIYWQKALSHRKKVADVGFVWHLDTLFQPNDISVETSLLHKIPLSTFTSKTIDRK